MSAENLTLTVSAPRALWVEQRLRAIDKKVRTKVISKATRAGAKVIQRRAQSNAPVRSGKARKAIKVRAAKYVGGKGNRRRKKRGEVAFDVRLGAGNFTGETFYGAFQEFGWKTGRRNPKGKRKQQPRRQIPGLHFMERAGKQGETEAVTVINAETIRGLDEAGKA